MLHDYVAKIVLVGDAGVGKSCVLMRYLENRFHHLHDLTIGVEFGAKIVTVRGIRLKLHVWDTAGQEGFQKIVRSYYRGITAVVLVYDVTRRTSFDNVLKWLQEVESESANPIVMLVANKTDAPKQQVASEEGVALAKEHGMLFASVSAKTGSGVTQMFTQLADELVLCVENGAIHDMVGLNEAPHQPKRVTLDSPSSSTKCCRL